MNDSIIIFFVDSFSCLPIGQFWLMYFISKFYSIYI
jgi:hypothetical protein